MGIGTSFYRLYKCHCENKNPIPIFFMEYFTIEEMIKLNVGEHIVKGYMELLYQLYAEALIESEKLRNDEEQNLIDYKF